MNVPALAHTLVNSSKYLFTSKKEITNHSMKEKKYIIKLKKNTDYTKFISANKLNEKLPKKINLLNSLSIKLTPEEYELLKFDSSVEYIEPDSTVSAFDDNVLDT
jgi:hypothetical protein